MPFPPLPLVQSLTRSSLTALGCPGTVIPSITGPPFNPLHLLADLLLVQVWPQVLAGFQMGVFKGSLGGPSALAMAPAPQPLITALHVQAAVAALLPLVPGWGVSAALLGAWLGPMAPSLAQGLALGALEAFKSSSPQIGPAGGVDPVFTALTGGCVEFYRVPLVAQTLAPGVLGAWDAHPDLGPWPRLGLALAWLTPLCNALNALQLSCVLINPAPPAVAPVVGVPYFTASPVLIV